MPDFYCSTYLNTDSLAGNSRTTMIVTVCPTEINLDDTLFTAQFATRVHNIQIGVAQRQGARDLTNAVNELQMELKDMQSKKIMVIYGYTKWSSDH